MSYERNDLARNNPIRLLQCLICVAGLIMGPASLHAANVPNPCVSTVEELHAAFELASSGEEFNTVDGDIRIVVGTYGINNSYFQYGSSNTKTLDVSGGWNSDCSQQVEDPRLTIISGIGSSKQLIVSNSAGDVSFRFLTFKGGNVTTGGSALQMNTAGSTGQVILDNDIFTANTGGDSVVDVGGSTFVQVDNSLFYANSAAKATIRVGNPDISGNTAVFEAINNTMTQNTIPNAASTGQIVLVLKNSSSTATICNNIFYGSNTGEDSVTISGAGNVAICHNIIGADDPSGVTVTYTGNTYGDPKFANSTDFHLQPTSPALAVGALVLAHGADLPQLDLDGFPRTWSGHVDLGAYERGDEIFKDGFQF